MHPSTLAEAMRIVSLGDESQDQCQQRRPEKTTAVEQAGLGGHEHEQGRDKRVRKVFTPFPFLDLPTEIRLRVYMFVLFTSRRGHPLRVGGSIGASAKNMPLAPLSHRLSLLLTSRRIHDEAAYYFYSSQTFRVFPIQDYSKLPTVRALSSQYRACLKTIELILGSSWTKPPRSWAVNDSLGLKDMVNVHTLKIFIECDPSHPVFRGFRLSKGYYTWYAGDLLRRILKDLPNLVQVEFDGYPSVQKSGDLMRRLLLETRLAKKKILWGPKRGWTDYDDDDHEKKDYDII